MSHYDTLGVAKDADQSEIKKAYRRLASVHHPDKNNGNDAHFKKIGEAYDILSDEGKRQEYDMYPNGRPQMHMHGGHFNFEDMFRQHRHQQRENPNSIANIQITLKQAYDGEDYQLNLDSGTIKLKIPPGTRSGTKMRLPGKGSTRFLDLPPGDLYVVINILMPLNWGWNNDDLYYQTKVDAISAMIGATAEIDHISGKKYKLEIPAGSQHGDKVRLKGLGMVNPVNTVVGNLYIIIDIFIPTVTEELDRNTLSNLRGKLNGT